MFRNKPLVVTHTHRWLFALLLATLMVLAHGCHAGDHDDELFRRWPTTGGPP